MDDLDNDWADEEEEPEAEGAHWSYGWDDPPDEDAWDDPWDDDPLDPHSEWWQTCPGHDYTDLLHSQAASMRFSQERQLVCRVPGRSQFSPSNSF